MQGQYNLRNPAVKRLMKEAQELREPTEQYAAQPLEDNLFEWHFTIRGPGDSDFEGGLYHGRIVLPPEYPMKPPSIILLTPNGRFETYKKICLSISGHHPESWQPSWSIRTALLAIIGFMPTHGNGAIGSLDYKPEERKVLAKRSQDWKCPNCGNINHILPPVTEASKATREEAKELASQINFQGEKEKGTSESGDVNKKEEPSATEKDATKDGENTTPQASSVPQPELNPQHLRFPVPPMGMPFMPPMFPPGFKLPNQNGDGTNPQMRGGGFIPPMWPPPGMMPNNTNGNVRMPFIPPFLPPGFAPVPPQTQATTPVSSESSTVTSASTTAANIEPSTTTTTEPARSSPTVTSTTESSQPPEATVPQNEEPVTPTATSSSSPAQSLRQRTATTLSDNPLQRQIQPIQSAELPPQPSENPVFIVIIVVICLILAALIVRRVLMLDFWQTGFDAFNL